MVKVKKNDEENVFGMVRDSKIKRNSIWKTRNNKWRSSTNGREREINDSEE